MITKSMIHDEARRRMAVVHGARYGSDMTQKALNSVILHLVSPSVESLHRLQYHLAVLSAANQLETALPADFIADHHWPVPPISESVPSIDPAHVPVVVNNDNPELRRQIDELKEAFLNHSHVPEPVNGREINWSDFALRDEVEKLVANARG